MCKQLEPEVIASINSGRKIEAIKKLRVSRGIGLKEAKQLVDNYYADNNIPNTTVERGSFNSLAKLIVLLVIGYALYLFFG
jgi:multisubunit Na+/H+ antiporter MnhB subunit